MSIKLQIIFYAAVQPNEIIKVYVYSATKLKYSDAKQNMYTELQIKMSLPD